MQSERLHPFTVHTPLSRHTHSAPSTISPTLTPYQLLDVARTRSDKVEFEQDHLTEPSQLVKKITGARMTSPALVSYVPRPPTTPKPQTVAVVKVGAGLVARRRPHVSTLQDVLYMIIIL